MKLRHKICISLLFVIIILCVKATTLTIEWRKNTVAGKKFIALTFDDGPNGIATLETLKVLKKYNIKAAFFLIGKNVERYPDIARQIAQGGHIIGNHSYGHDDLLIFASKEQVKANLEKNNQVIHDITGVTPKYFRPPNGLTSKNIKKACDELGMKIVGVNVFIHDPINFNVTKIVNWSLKAAKNSNGGIMILHDGFSLFNMPARKVVAEALDRLIPLLQKDGYDFLRIDQI